MFCQRGSIPAPGVEVLPCTLSIAGRRHRQVAAYSTQSDKVINSGEGGFVTTSDDEIAARAIFLSGAYERRYCERRYGATARRCESISTTVFVIFRFCCGRFIGVVHFQAVDAAQQCVGNPREGNVKSYDGVASKYLGSGTLHAVFSYFPCCRWSMTFGYSFSCVWHFSAFTSKVGMFPPPTVARATKILVVMARCWNSWNPQASLHSLVGTGSPTAPRL